MIGLSRVAVRYIWCCPPLRLCPDKTAWILCHHGLLNKCRHEDVGKPKAEVAAKRVMQRVSGVKVTVHVGTIQDKPTEFYEQFTIFILGLDSIEARRYMNGIACSLLGVKSHTSFWTL